MKGGENFFSGQHDVDDSALTVKKCEGILPL